MFDEWKKNFSLWNKEIVRRNYTRRRGYAKWSITPRDMEIENKIWFKVYAGIIDINKLRRKIKKRGFRKQHYQIRR